MMTDIIFRDLKQQDYQKIWNRMKTFTDERDSSTKDEIWFVEHPPVFTLGQSGKREHLLNPDDIPIIQTDRGGQVTYHGPGQLIAYVLLDLKRRKLGIRSIVSSLEQSAIDLLKEFNIQNVTARRDAPGVYVNGAKIVSVGLRIRRGCSYHGMSFNVAMDLEPFSRINPCGLQNLQVTQLSDFTTPCKIKEIIPLLQKHLSQQFIG